MIDLELRNCRIYGNDESLDTICIKDGRIIDVRKGSTNQSGKWIDLEGRTVLPGYIDSHTHLMNLGLALIRLDLSNTKSRSEAIERTVEHAGASTRKVVIGYGWDETVWGEEEYLSRSELDSADKPVILFRKDMHMAVANSRALSLAGIDSRTGVVREEELRSLDPIVEPGDEEIREAIGAASRKASSEGITTVRDIMGLRTLSTVNNMDLPIRIFHIIYDREYSGQSLNLPLSWGIKMFLDGSVGSESAAHEGWDSANLKFSSEKLQSILSGYWQRGIPVAMHAIGEIAVRQAIESLKQQKGRLRNSIEHFEMLEEDWLQDIGKSTVLSSQPNFLQWSLKGGLYENKLGKMWFGRDNPFREIIDSGLHLAFGSDCMPMGPSYGIGLAVNSPHSRQRITMGEAIDAYTSGGAFLLHEEHVSGSIRTGHRADLAVFEENYLSDPTSIGTRKAEMTLLGGNVMHNTGNLMLRN